MGSELESATFTREQRQQYRQKAKACLDVFEQMLGSHSFDFDRQVRLHMLYFVLNFGNRVSRSAESRHPLRRLFA